MTYSLTWLPEVLERAGLKVAETPNWRTRGRAEMGTVKGVMCHHTGTARGGNMPTLDLLIRGRSDLAGPLCHLGLGRDGTFYIVAAGRANHAGEGRWEGLRTGNSNFIGIEAEHTGNPNEEWPEAQLDAYSRGVAALLKHVGAGANMCCGHKEYAPGRKPDPTFDMAAFRAEIADLLDGKSPPPAIPARDAQDRPTLRRGMRSDAVKVLQRLLGVGDDGIFGGNTEARLRAWQRAHQLVPDGIAGPVTWSILDRETPAAVRAAVEEGKPVPVEPAGEPAKPHPVIDQIDLALLRSAFPRNTATELKEWVEPLKAACRQFGIDKDRELCSFLANIAVESNDLTQMTESLNYSADGLLKTFGRHRISEADARRLGRKPGEGRLSEDRQKELANLLYGGKWGRENLGNTEEGDGWRFRGYGPKQITGRDNCQRFGDAVGKSIDEVPDYLRTRVGGCMGAGWFWHANKLDAKAATPGLKDDRLAINAGGLGLDRVEATFNVLMAELGRRPKGG